MINTVWFVHIIGKLIYSGSFTDKYCRSVSADKKK